jgi:hypothetical protein
MFGLMDGVGVGVLIGRDWHDVVIVTTIVEASRTDRTRV